MSRHQKSISAPKTFPIPRKGKKWTIKPSPGPHSKDNCIPLGIVVRDILEYANSVKEVKKVLKAGKCEVDGKIVKDHRYPLGMFDSLKLGEEFYRLVPSKKGFDLIKINEEEAGKKLCKVEDKKPIKDGKLQLNLNDGKNIIVNEDEMDDLETGSSLVLSLPEMKVERIVERDSGQKVMITEGKNKGKIAQLKEFKTVKGSERNRVIVESEKRKIDLPEELIFPVGEGNLKVNGD